MIVGGLVLICGGLPAMMDLSRYWWCLAFFIAGFVVVNLGRRRHDLLLMARNESARRSSDLQYQLDAAGGGADLAPSQGRVPANPVLEIRPGRRTLARALAWIGVIFAGMVVFAGVRVAEEGVLPEVFDSGTPARATVINCVPHQYRGIDGYRCNATWSVGGSITDRPDLPLGDVARRVDRGSQESAGSRIAGGCSCAGRTSLPTGQPSPRYRVHLRGVGPNRGGRGPVVVSAAQIQEGVDPAEQELGIVAAVGGAPHNFSESVHSRAVRCESRA